MKSYLCNEKEKHQPSITLFDNDIYSWTCQCEDFTFRQCLKEPVGKCKHILKFMTELRDNLTSEVKNE